MRTRSRSPYGPVGGCQSLSARVSRSTAEAQTFSVARGMVVVSHPRPLPLSAGSRPRLYAASRNLAGW